MAPTDLLEGLRRLWRAVAKDHPEHRDAPITLNLTGRPIRCGEAGRRLREGLPPTVLVNPQDVPDARAAVEVLLHELAHLVAASRGLADTSKEGAYHSATFRTVAEEVGLPVAYTGAIRGWWPDPEAALPDRLMAVAARIPDLGTEVVPTPKRSPRNYVRAACSCGRVIRVAPRTLDEAGIRCERCGTLFTL